MTAEPKKKMNQRDVAVSLLAGGALMLGVAWLYGAFAADYRQWFYWRGLLFVAAASVSGLMFAFGVLFVYLAATKFFEKGQPA